MKLRIGLMIVISGLVAFLVYQFFLAPPIEPLAQETKIAVWMGIEWSMEAKTDVQIESLANDLKAHGVDYTFVYVSYLRSGDSFNPTYDHAAEFTRRMKAIAPEISLLAWVGVPIGIEQLDGTYEDNRLQREEIRLQIAAFAAFTVNELGFDGIHLNAEILQSGNTAFLETLQAIRVELPNDALLSTTSHALRIPQSVTLVPYPTLGLHATPEFFREMALYADQIAIMAYDSGLPFPRDFRSWVQYQVEASADALSDSDVELLIGLPVSEEWTGSHQTQAETLTNGLYGFRLGYSDRINGIALYPYWELSADEWQQIHRLQPE